MVHVVIVRGMGKLDHFGRVPGGLPPGTHFDRVVARGDYTVCLLENRQDQLV